MMVRILLLSLALCSAAVPRYAVAAELASHRATYHLDIAPGSAMAGMGTLAGEMVIELTDGCDEWLGVATLSAAIRNQDGEEFRFENRRTTREGKDGRSFHVDVWRSNTVAGEETETAEATLSARGGGSARLGEEATDVVSLPQGTLFPQAHLLHLIDRLRSGETLDYSLVFLGRSPSPLVGVSTTMTRVYAAGEAAVLSSPLLDDSASWQLTFAYFDDDDESGLPIFEMSGRFYENGVGAFESLTVGSLTMRARLVALEALPSGCG